MDTRIAVTVGMLALLVGAGVAAAAGADLTAAITGVSVKYDHKTDASGKEVVTGDIKVQIVISNVGTGAASATDVKVLLDGVQAKGKVDALSAGGTDTVVVRFQNVPLGMHTVTAVADARDRVAELDERNNQEALTIYV